MIAPAQHALSAADLELILALQRGGTLSAAGIRLRMDPSSVFRGLQRLEKQLGMRLFERGRAGYLAGDLAQRIALHAERVEADLEGARGAICEPRESVAGLVRLSTTDTLLEELVLPALRTLADRHPHLQMELVATHELASLTKRDADIALRATKRAPQHLVGRQLGVLRAAVYRARGTRYGKLAPALCPWVVLDDALPEHPSVKWRLKAYPKVVPRWRMNSVLAVQQAVEAGLGVGVLPVFMAERSRKLAVMGEVIDECETDLWLLTHPESRHLRRIAAVAGHLVESIRLA